jgi:ammonium transporter Rh
MLLDRKTRMAIVCGVHKPHGMPGLLGGLAAIFVIPGIATAQLVGIACTVVPALAGGVASGFILRATGAKQKAYKDYEEFDAIPEPQELSTLGAKPSIDGANRA